MGVDSVASSSEPSQRMQSGGLSWRVFRYMLTLHHLEIWRFAVMPLTFRGKKTASSFPVWSKQVFEILQATSSISRRALISEPELSRIPW